MVLYLLQVEAWAYLLLRGLGVKLSLRQVLKGYMLSGLVRYVPGGFWGHLSRSQWLYEHYGIPYKITNVGSVLQVTGWVVSAGVVAGVYWGFAQSGWLQATIILLTTLFPLGVWFVLRGLAKWDWLKWLSNRGVVAVAFLEVPLWRWMAFVITGSVLWIGKGGVVCLAAGGIGLSPIGGVFDAAFALTVAWLVGFLIIFVPTGLGIREVALSSLLVMQTGMTLEHASAISVMTRFLMLLAESSCLLVGLLVSSRETPRN